jgi:RNA polymerase sigma-70 factor (ECF subfamily)
MAHDLATLDDLLAHAAWMRGLARRLLGDGDEADDVVQDAWLSALRLPPARGHTLRPWMATVILNLVRSRARSGARTRAREQLFGSPDPAPAAEEMLVQLQTERKLAQLVLALDEPYRRTILLRFHDGQSSAEIAREEGIPEGTVRWRLKYGLDELRRRFAKDEPGGEGKVALGALVPLVGPRSLPPAVPVPAAATGSSWLARAALLPGKAVLTAAGAAAAFAVVAAGVHHHHHARTLAPAPRLVATAQTEKTASAPVLPPEPAALQEDPGQPAPDVEPAHLAPSPPSASMAAGEPLPPVPAPTPLTAITGIVRDSRGQAAAGVPVTLRTLVGSGAADRSTTTDQAGRFNYQLQPHSKVVLTAELQGEPAARLEIEVPAKSAISLDAEPSLGSTGASFATIDVALGPTPRRSPAGAGGKAHPVPGAPLSRWCCRHAFMEGDLVYGRACLKFDDNTRSDQSGCALYGLKAQISCHHYTHGGLSTGDLSRTERLDCDGRLL